MMRAYYRRYRQEAGSILKELLGIHGKIAILVLETEYLIGLILGWAAFGQKFVMEETVKWLVVTVAPVIITGIFALVFVALRTPAVMDKGRADKYTELGKEKQAEIDQLNQNIVSLQRRIDPKIEIFHGNDRKFYEKYGDHLVCRIGIRNKSEVSRVRAVVEIDSIVPEPIMSLPKKLHWKGDDIREGETYKDSEEIMRSQTTYVDVVSIWVNGSTHSDKFAIQHTHQPSKNLIDAVDSDLMIRVYPSEGVAVSETLLIRRSENGQWKIGIGENLFDLKEIYNSIPDIKGELIFLDSESNHRVFIGPHGGSIEYKEETQYQAQPSRRKGSRYKKPKTPFDNGGHITRA